MRFPHQSVQFLIVRPVGVHKRNMLICLIHTLRENHLQHKFYDFCCTNTFLMDCPHRINPFDVHDFDKEALVNLRKVLFNAITKENLEAPSVTQFNRLINGGFERIISNLSLIHI